MYQPKTDGNVAGNGKTNSTEGPQRYVYESAASVPSQTISATGLGLDKAYDKKYVGL